MKTSFEKQERIDLGDDVESNITITHIQADHQAMCETNSKDNPRKHGWYDDLDQDVEDMKMKADCCFDDDIHCSFLPF